MNKNICPNMLMVVMLYGKIVGGFTFLYTLLYLIFLNKHAFFIIKESHIIKICHI